MPPRPQGPRRILVVGCGIGGATLAWWLAEYGFEVTVVERAPGPRTGGYMIDFWGLGYEVAERMGILPQLQEVGYHIEAFRLVRDDGRTLATLGPETMAAAAGGSYVSLMRGDLATTLTRKLGSGVELRFGDRPVELVERGGGVSITFERAKPADFDLVIGADGVHSEVRQALFPTIGETPVGLWTAAFRLADYPNRDPGAYVSFTDVGCQIARYALRDGSTAFFLVFRPPPGPLPCALADQKALLHQEFDGLGWECGDILAGLSRCTELYFDTVAQVELPAWSDGRLALVGDAAYSPSLLAGEGASLAMAGAYVLAGELQRFAGDFEAAFARYEQFLKPLTQRKQRGARRMAGWFAPRTQIGLIARNGLTRLASSKFMAPILLRDFTSNGIELPCYAERHDRRPALAPGG
jgi:2-polyprenyl-6-methoxyphenol hydroxylase-like FAD-dependent oxidoreductase